MNPKFRFCVAASLWLAAAVAVPAASLSITTPPGWNLIANQVDGANGNGIRNILSTGVPIGSTIQKFSLATKSFQTLETLTATAGWQPGTNILNPGEGLYFSNAASASIILTISGFSHTPVLPLNIGNGAVLVARQTNEVAGIRDILGYTPPNFTVVYRYNAGFGYDPNVFAAPNYTIYAFVGGIWTSPNGAPNNIRIGESVWVNTNGSLPIILSDPKDATVCAGSRAVVSVQASGTPPLTYQWFLNGNPIPTATNPSYIIPSVDAATVGTYTAKVTNPFGATTSAGAVISIYPPPQAATLSNQVACLGGSVTFYSGAVGAGPFTFSWKHNGNILPNQVSSNLVLTAIKTTDEGIYCVTIVDSCGNSATYCATLSIGDVEPPSLACPQDYTMVCQGTNGMPLNYEVGIRDNCDPAPTLVCDPPPGTLIPPGLTTVTCTGKDAAGNTATCRFTVMVVDDLPPVINCPDDITAIALRSNSVPVTYTVTAVDNCDPNPVVKCDPPSGSLFALGTTLVACTAEDSAGNVSPCRFQVVVAPPSCCQGKAWSGLNISTPGARQGHAMAYDSGRGRIVLFGGVAGTTYLGDTWEWDGTNWNFMTTAGPSPRSGMAMAYHPGIALTILFGGTGANGVSGDTWAWDGLRWRLLDISGPGARSGHAMACDVARSAITLFGGISASGSDLGDTWEFDGSQWIPVTQTGPGPRQGPMMAYGGAAGRVTLFGGYRSPAAILGDTWNWDGKDWKLLATSGPPARAYGAMAYNDNCDATVLFGGGTSLNNQFSDTWEWDGTSWTLTASNNPPARIFTAMAHDSNHNKTVLFGGQIGDRWAQDMWTYGPDTAPPVIRTVYAACDENELWIGLSKPVTKEGALDPANYLFSCGGVNIPILEIHLSDDRRVITLVLASPVSGGCVLIVNGLQDNCGHTVRGLQRSVECAVDPCPRGSAGTEYWLTFPGNYAPDRTNPPQPQLFITGIPGTVGSVSMPGITPPFVAGFTLPASGVSIMQLPKEADLANAIDLVENKGIHVVASQKVSVYGHNHISYTTDSYLGLATKTLGKAYLILAYQNMFTNAPELNGVQFALAVAFDNTTVTIVPSASVGAHPAGIPYNLTLMRGQTYQMRDTNMAPVDLTGTIIVADQPIAVFAGHQCANIPSADLFFCDYIVEQIFPAEMYGNNFVTVPFWPPHTNGNTIRCLALLDGTSVSINGAAVALLNQGQFFEKQLTGNAWITSTRPVLVAQHSDSADYNLVDNSDPFMVLIPPTPLYSTGYTIEVPETGFSENYINITTLAAAVGQITLDGFAIGALAYSPIGASGYSGARVAVTPGPHTLASLGGQSFGVVVYGWSLFDSYGYPAGTCGTKQQGGDRFTCPPTNVVVEVGHECTAFVPDLRSQVGNGSLAFIILQEPPPGTPVGPGTYTITVTIVSRTGDRQICTTLLTVPPPPFPGLQCPADIVTNTTNSAGEIVFYQPTLCNTNFKANCDPPSGTLFPVGSTTVTCISQSPTGGTEQCSFSVNVVYLKTAIAVQGSNVVVSWTGTGTLQKSTNVMGPYIPILNATNPYTISIREPKNFFRIAP